MLRLKSPNLGVKPSIPKWPLNVSTKGERSEERNKIKEEEKKNKEKVKEQEKKEEEDKKDKEEKEEEWR